MEQMNLKELLSILHGKYLDYPVYVENQNIKYYISEVGYSTNSGTYFECVKEKPNKETLLREILSLLHYHNLENIVTVKIENDHLDITELISNSKKIIFKA